MSIAVKRASKEFQSLQSSDNTADGIISVSLVGDDIKVWSVVLSGPPETPYANGKFIVRVIIENDYPNKAPTVLFITKVYHPSVAVDGKLCEEIFRDWTPSWTVKDAMCVVRNMLCCLDTPNVVNPEAAEHFHKSKDSFLRAAAKHTAQYATG